MSAVAARGTVEMLSAPERVKVSTDVPSQPLSSTVSLLGDPMMRYRTDLRNLMHFLSLRAIPTRNTRSAPMPRQRRVPMTYLAFLEFRMNAAVVSATGLAVIRRMIGGAHVDQASSDRAAGMARADGVASRPGGLPQTQSARGACHSIAKLLFYLEKATTCCKGGLAIATF